MRTSAPLLAPIFRSDGQARLLAAILLTGDELSVTELAARADLAYPTAHREVARLIDAGILRERPVGRTRLVSGNPDSPLVAPLQAILLASAGPVPLLAAAFDDVPGIERAFLYGSFAARARGVAGAAPNDIDVMVIGTPDAATVYDACAAVEHQVGRSVNPTILTPAEYADDSAFLRHVRENPVVPVIGDAP